MGLDVHFSGQLYEQRAREKFLSNIDNSTRESVIIDLEIYTVPILLGLCFLIGIMSIIVTIGSTVFLQ